MIAGVRQVLIIMYHNCICRCVCACAFKCVCVCNLTAAVRCFFKSKCLEMLCCWNSFDKIIIIRFLVMVSSINERIDIFTLARHDDNQMSRDCLPRTLNALNEMIIGLFFLLCR